MRQRWCIALRLPVQLRANNQSQLLKLTPLSKSSDESFLLGNTEYHQFCEKWTPDE